MWNVHLLYGAKLENVALEVLLEYDKCFKVGQWSYPCGFYMFYLYKYDKVGKTDTLQMYLRPATMAPCRVATLVCPVRSTK